jgi:hypothetical protein
MPRCRVFRFRPQATATGGWRGLPVPSIETLPGWPWPAGGQPHPSGSDGMVQAVGGGAGLLKLKDRVAIRVRRLPFSVQVQRNSRAENLKGAWIGHITWTSSGCHGTPHLVLFYCVCRVRRAPFDRDPGERPTGVLGRYREKWVWVGVSNTSCSLIGVGVCQLCPGRTRDAKKEAPTILISEATCVDVTSVEFSVNRSTSSVYDDHSRQE